MKKILCVIGTRPEAIKMAPVILALKNENWANVRVMATAQHRHLMDQILTSFGIEPEIDLDIMQPNQDLNTLTARLLLETAKVLEAEMPDAVLVQGDTTTVMASALASFYKHIPIGHVEAGLRTGDMHNPFPEEMNRVITGRLAQWHFAPTKSSKINLINEGIAENRVFVTGNTVIDALLMVANQTIDFVLPIDEKKRMILVTSHRRENFGEPFKEICSAIRSIAETNEDVQILYPVHPNPNIKNVAYDTLGDLKNVILTDPMEYAPFIKAMKRAHFIISDSGGVQEEAPALGKPVLVMRDETERPEAVDEGVVKLVGPHKNNIIAEAQILLDDHDAYKRMAKGISPYGDGNSAQRIVRILSEHFITKTR